MGGIVPFSYRMKIRVEPHWEAIVKRILEPSSDEKFSEMMKKVKAEPVFPRMLSIHPRAAALRIK